MTSRAVSTRDGSRMPSTGRLLLGGALVLGVGATLVLVMSDDARFLKLGIVAALWSALVGAFLAARFRRQVTDRADDAADMQAVYELELEREIAARREYELELEAEAKRKAAEESRQDIDALRTELSALRETLQTLLGGEVLVERFALAQATRMRSLSEESPQLGGQNPMKRISASPGQASREQVVVPAEPQTELMDRVVERHQSRQNTNRPPTQRPQRPAPREQQRPPRESERQVQVRPQRAREEVVDPGSGWWEPVTPPGREPQQEATAYHRPIAGDSRKTLGEGLDMEWTPSWERNGSQAPPAQPPMRQSTGRPPRPPKAPTPSQPLPRPEQETRVQAPVKAPEPRTKVRQPAATEPPTKVRPPMASDPPTRIQAPIIDPPRLPTPPVEPPRLPVPPVEPPRMPAPAVEQGGRRRADERPPAEPTGGRRRAPEPEVRSSRHSDPVEPPAGGRRRRPDDAGGRQNSGSHAKPSPEASGSHAEGKSVSELIAAYGGADNPRRRRRRDD